MNKIKFDIIRIIGIGAFTYLILSGVLKIVEELLLDVFTLLDLDNNLLFWANELVVLVLFAFTAFFVVKFLYKKIKASKDKIKALFTIVFIGFFVVQILQFLYTYFGTGYLIENHYEKYMDFYKDNVRLIPYSSLFDLCKPLLFGIIILMVSKTASSLNTND